MWYKVTMIDAKVKNMNTIGHKFRQVVKSPALILVAPLFLWASPAKSKESINLGYGGLNPMPHCHAKIYTIEYEHQLALKFSILGRGSRVNYKSDDGVYQEEGKLKGLDLGTRYYPVGDMHGFFVGASLGYWTGDWTSRQDKGLATEWQDKADSKSLRLNADVGYRLRLLDTKVSIIPQVNLGKFFSSSSCQYTAPSSRITAQCNETSEVKYYLFVGAAVGIAF